jgi:hypothetical protein
MIERVFRATFGGWAAVAVLIGTLSTMFTTQSAQAQDRCEFPQTPRDITSSDGAASGSFDWAPSASQLNLCNLHFHVNAEHKGPGFMFAAKSGDAHGGFVCNTGDILTDAERRPVHDVCGHGSHGVKPGDTIEVHWVYTSCPVDTVPGKGLKLCSSATCRNPTLRVESQVFLVVNNRDAQNFNRFDLAGWRKGGHVQPKNLPSGTGTPVTFLGSTTGPDWNDKCSPAKVTWNVRPKCARLDINSLKHWCDSNAYAEHHGHGVRSLVTNVYSLSRIGRE